MNWKIRSFIHNILAILPESLSYRLHYIMARYFGYYRKFDILSHFITCTEIIKMIQKYGYKIKEKTFFEVGTGRVPLIPIAFWLCGAQKIITIDLNPYMKNDLIKDMLYIIKNNENEIKKIFDDLLNKERFHDLLDKANKIKTNMNDILELCQIEYIVPGDAAKTNLPDCCIDYHFSHLVYEHIPLNILHDILKEGNRIIKQDGLFINRIDYQDHFAISDKNISVINNLQFDDKKWKQYAGNRYGYTNRGRHDDYLELFKTVGHEFIEIVPLKNEIVYEMLEKEEILLDNKFKSKTNEILSIVISWFITKKI